MAKKAKLKQTKATAGGSRGGLLLAARGGYGAPFPQDETWNMALVQALGAGRDATSKVVIWDRGFAANGFIRKFGNAGYYAFGGEFIDVPAQRLKPLLVARLLSDS